MRDGFLIIVAGPGNEEGEGDPLEREGRVGRERMDEDGQADRRRRTRIWMMTMMRGRAKRVKREQATS